MFDRLHDARVRTAAFEWLSTQVEIHGDVLPRTVLADGFTFEGTRVPLVGPQGIFKPRILSDAPLSATTAPKGPYDDAFGVDGLLRYRYRGTDPEHHENRGLRFAMQQRLPLVYFHGVIPGKYVAAWPVFVVADDPAGLAFTVAVDDAAHTGVSPIGPVVVHEGGETIRRQYVTAAVRQRLHQRAFRERVLAAYRHECAFCRFRHEELLDAAHIIPDKEPDGEPVVANGLSLCKLHHGAFDNYFVGVRPDYVIQVRPDILEENDGPTLVHGIQALHGKRMTVPRIRSNQPDQEFLGVRFERFLKAIA